jgi:hypothetical protein
VRSKSCRYSRSGRTAPNSNPPASYRARRTRRRSVGPE